MYYLKKKKRNFYLAVLLKTKLSHIKIKLTLQRNPVLLLLIKIKTTKIIFVN